MLAQWRPAPRGARTCPKDCNGVGVCNADTGYCLCPGKTSKAHTNTRQTVQCAARCTRLLPVNRALSRMSVRVCVCVCVPTAGWKGEDCATRQLRPCTNRLSDCDKDDWALGPVSHVDGKGRDLDPYAPGSTESRCSGRPGYARVCLCLCVCVCACVCAWQTNLYARLRYQ